MNSLLQQAVMLGALRPLDAQFARMISENNPALQLAAACLSAEAGAGNVCLLLEQLQPELLFDGRYPELAQALWQAAGALDTVGWQQQLTCNDAVSDGGHATPLVLQQQRLYLQRMWQSEGEVVGFFEQANRPLDVDESRLNQILQDLFPTQEAGIDWQKVAAAVAATRRISVISGGPGTGKTTTVARLLAALVQLQPERRLRIQLAAPTGKAAARLTSSLSHASEGLPLTEDQRKLFPQEASTLHRLLGAQPNSQRMRYHADNPLHLDVLVVDEASMVDLPMMARLIAALPDSAQVIFLGDRDQLASVEAGAVLGDICHFAELDYSPERAAELTRLTGYQLPAQEVSGATVRDSLCLLRHSYRFDAQSGIGQLALAVNQGQSGAAMAALKGNFADIAGYSLANSDDYQHLLQACVAGYRHYLQLVAAGAKPGLILDAFSRFQLLCALRDGPFGVSGLNERIEASLHHAGLIQRKPGLLGRWYAGRPVMISRNDSTLGLFNGDIGICLAAPEDDILRVYFPLPDGGIKSVQPSRLPSHETAYAMTVHKSQGSEFDHTLLVLPNKVLPLLSRELVYTAITRARKQLSVYAPDAVLRMAIKRPTQRRSGLKVRITEQG